jgi:hypothetical protein
MRGSDVARRFCLAVSALVAVVAAGCNNSPYWSGAERENTMFYAFDERSPRSLDPTQSYSNPESAYTFQIYEPPYGYHYLNRPYELIPKAATEVARPRYIDKDGRPLPDDAPAGAIAESIYDIRIRPGILYAPHPAFAKDGQGKYRYLNLTREQLGSKRSPLDFEHQAHPDPRAGHLRRLRDRTEGLREADRR